MLGCGLNNDDVVVILAFGNTDHPLSPFSDILKTKQLKIINRCASDEYNHELRP